VALRHADRETDIFARVDIGASFCIFQRLHAETVGIVVESGAPMRISTVTGGFLAYAHQVTLGVLGIEVEATVYFAEALRCRGMYLGKPDGSTACDSAWWIMTGSSI
jgi:hypothetical protein